MQHNNVNIRQDRRQIGEKIANSCSHLIYLIGNARDVSQCPHGPLLNRWIKHASFELGPDQSFSTRLPNDPGTQLSILCMDPAIAPFALLTRARETIATLRSSMVPAELVIAVFGSEDDELAARFIEALVAAALAADFPLPEFKKKDLKPRVRLKTIRIFGHEADHQYRRTLAEARGNNTARWLTALPPNELTPRRYREAVIKIARTYRWKTEFLDIGKLRKKGAGAFLAVAQGSPEPDAGILHIRYEPRKQSGGDSLSLVGKGICFDTGGTNLKPARYMHGMHEDMEGSAVALGTLIALAELEFPYPVDCWLALAQNHIGPHAYKQNDVVRAANGMTIEVMHTDAEGRMVLADTLTLASRLRPKMIIDFATLTGACVGALSTRMSGAVTNRFDLAPLIIEAGQRSGERVWPFPLEKDFSEALKSDIADIKQCTLDSDADHILAAAFLNRFIENNVPWVHVDLSAGNHKGGLAHVPTATTGFGVRFTLNLLLDVDIVDAL